MPIWGYGISQKEQFRNTASVNKTQHVNIIVRIGVTELLQFPSFELSVPQFLIAHSSQAAKTGYIVKNYSLRPIMYNCKYKLFLLVKNYN
jgi:hypothetical protein